MLRLFFRKKTLNNTKEKELFPTNRKAKWGWGWLVIWLLITPGVQLLITKGGNPVNTQALSFLFTLLFLFISITFYFWNRRRILNKNQYTDTVWQFSFIAGFETYIVSILLFIFFTYILMISDVNLNTSTTTGNTKKSVSEVSTIRPEISNKEDSSENSSNPSNQEWFENDWHIERLDAGQILFRTFGKNIPGHSFGFIKIDHQCDTDILLITWSSYGTDIKSFEGTDTTMKIDIGEASFNIELPLRYTIDRSPHLSLLAFTNFLTGEGTISLLKKNTNLQLDIIRPIELTEQLDTLTDSFSLDGYSRARDIAKAYCQP